MKKIVLAVMAVAAIGFTASCGNKTQQADAVDSVAIVDSLAGEAANATISALTEQLEAKDANKLQETLTAIKEKIASLIKENPEVAKEYVAKVQNYLKENADKIKEVAGENGAIAAAVSAVTAIEPANIVNGFLNAVDSTATSAKDAAVDAAVNAKDAAVNAATDAANNAKDAAKQKANEAVDNAADQVKKGLGL